MSVQVRNLTLAENFRTLGKLTSLDGGSVWSIRAYNKAADILSGLDIPADNVSDFKKFSGIGDGVAKLIGEMIKTGSCGKLNVLRKKFPNAEKALSLTVVSGVGPKKAIILYNQGITTLEELEKACADGRVTSGQIARGVKMALKSRGRLPINEVVPVVDKILEALRELPEVQRAEFAGSVRRGRETVKDCDILIVATDRAKVTEKFLTFGEELISGEEKARIMAPIDAKTVVQVDLLYTNENQFGAALAYFTGSKEHNIALRKRALSMGYTINEHGIYQTHSKGKVLTPHKRVGGAEEEELYHKLDLPWHPPELREGNNFCDWLDGDGLSSLSSYPLLVTSLDTYGDWHMHSTWSADAKDTIEDMAIAAKARGLKMIGLTDHTEKNYGWDPNKIPDRIKECKAASEKVGITIFPACETGVNKDGTLDWPDQYLNQMAYVIASIHRSHAVEPVKRLIKAARHPKVRFIGHPTGRMIGRRDIPEDDWDELFKVCASEGVYLEINGARLDLPVNLIRKAKSHGCKFVLNSDAHAIDQLHWQDYAILFARRAGLTKSDLAKPHCEVIDG
jgi:DNA polymerase (family 10)